MQVRKIDRKLKACHNPLLDPESDAFKQLAAAAELQERQERDRKVCSSSLHLPSILAPDVDFFAVHC